MFCIPRLLLAFCALLGLALSPSQEALAHRVNIFAYSDGQNVHVHAGFSRSQPARNAEISVSLPGKDTLLLTLKTNEAGDCSFPIPAEASQYGLNIRVNAGEGHANTWSMGKEEFGAKPQSASESPSEPPSKQGSQEEMATNHANLQELVRTELAQQLAPLRLELAETREKIRFTDILGGIGWLVGLAGIVSALLTKRKPQA